MQYNKTHSGSTLLEVILSIAIIASVFVLFQATINTVFLNRASKHRSVALRVAQTEINNLRAISFASLPASGPISNSLLDSLPQGQAILTVTSLNSATKQLDVLVSWREPTSQTTSTINLSTIITKNGI